MPTESPYPRIDIPDVDLWQFLFENKQRQFPDDQVIFTDTDTGRSYNYLQIRNTAIDFAKGLKALWGWKKDDVLNVFSPNCIDTPAITWGVHWTGGVVTPANPGYTVDELAFQLKDAGAKGIVTQLHLLPTATKAAEKAGIPADRIILIGDQRDKDGRYKHFTSIRNISGTTRFRRPKLVPNDDIAFLVYSSGTTGHPKGVMLTHTNVVANVLQTGAAEGDIFSWKGGHDGKGDRLMAFLPFFHIYGLTEIVHKAMYRGVPHLVMPKFEIERFCQLVQEHKVKFSLVVPPVVLLLGKHPAVAKYDLSSLQMMSSGAAPLTWDLTEEVYNRIKVPIKQGYGMSEMSPTTHTQQWEDWNKFPGSVGKLLPNQTAKYMDPDGKEVPVGETGELWMKGPNVFKGYLNNPEGTASVKTEDGYFKTGDVGHQDQHGNFYITDRVKELIKYKGFQVAPAELEGLLASHPKIADAAVVGVYDKSQATELPRAYVVVGPGVDESKETGAEIIGWLNAKVAPHKRLRGGILFVKEVPKSASGKILRRLLKVRAQKELDGAKAKL